MKNEIFHAVYIILLYGAGFYFGYMAGLSKERQNHKKYYDKGYSDGMKAEAFHRDLCEEESEEV